VIFVVFLFTHIIQHSFLYFQSILTQSSSVRSCANKGVPNKPRIIEMVYEMVYRNLLSLLLPKEPV